MFVLLFVVFGTGSLFSQSKLKQAEAYADSVCKSLTIEQKVAQLIFVRANYPGQPYITQVDTLIKDYDIAHAY